MEQSVIVTIILSLFASSGFWALISQIIIHKINNNSAIKQMLMGLGHDRICFLGDIYIERGYIKRDEYENLVDYLYKPYKELGGNGTAEKVIEEVKKLPTRPAKYTE